MNAFTFPANYTAEERSQPECGAFMFDELGSPSSTLAPIAAGEQRTCVVRITRTADAIDNTFLIWRANSGLGDSDRVTMTLGTFVDISFAATSVSSTVGADGIRTTIVAVSARNDGDIAADNVLMGLGDVCTVPVVTVSTDLPGGCEPDTIFCQFVGGPGAAARFSTLHPRETQSCLVRLSAPDSAHATERVYLAPDRLTDAATGGSISDTDDRNNTILFDLAAPAGQAPAIGAPTLSRWSLGALILLLAGGATVAARRARLR